jgi:hypothetical protein
MEKVQKNSVNSVQHTPSSESFQVYLNKELFISLLVFQYIGSAPKSGGAMRNICGAPSNPAHFWSVE